MNRFFLVTMLACLMFQAQAQEKFTISGYVKDASNGEELIGVSVYLPQLKAGTTTNAYGFYSLTVPKGQYDIQFTYVGYQTNVLATEMTKNISQNIQLVSEATMMQEVVIEEKALDANVVDVQMSKNTVNMVQLRKLPALFGEPDIIKNIQMMPGVISAGEGTSAFFVRGGGADQNLILIDEAPIYDPSHLFGLFSVFNSDVIKDSDLYKGGIPARFGGRLSSILDVRTKDGNNKELHASGGIGTLATRLAVEGPIVKEKASFIVSARRSYVDLFLKAADSENSVYFYDINAKVNWKVNNKNRFFLAFYSGRDAFKFSGGDFGFAWGNQTGTFRWNHLFNDRLFSNTSIIVSKFDYKLESKDPVQAFKWTSDLQEISIKNDLSYFINTNNELTFGYHLAGRQFSPGDVSPNSEQSFFSSFHLDKMYAIDHGIYISNHQKLSDAITLDYGLRLSILQNVGKYDLIKYRDPKDNVGKERIDTVFYDSWRNIKTYTNLEPRIGIRYMLNPEQSIKVSYNRMVQNTHQIAAGTVPVPFNTWSPSNYYLEPQLADQYAAGYFRNFKDNMYEASVEAYYKDITNVTDFADNAQLLLNRDLSTEFRQGDSWGYGIEFAAVKKQGKLTGQVSYTWSKAERQIEGVNEGKRFWANYDRRNVVNVMATYDLNDKWSFGATFNYSTGRPITLPEGRYELDDYAVVDISERNGYRLPDYHRLDLSATLNPRKNMTRKWKGQWVFSVYNAYSRKNPFTVYTRTKQDDDGNVIDPNVKEARLIYLFPILPMVTYNFKF